MRTRYLVGLVLWRGGLMLSGGWVAYRTLRFALRYFDMPVPVEAGVALLLAGLLFVIVSIILENRQDNREATS